MEMNETLAAHVWQDEKAELLKALDEVDMERAAIAWRRLEHIARMQGSPEDRLIENAKERRRLGGAPLWVKE